MNTSHHSNFLTLALHSPPLYLFLPPFIYALHSFSFSSSLFICFCNCAALCITTALSFTSPYRTPLSTECTHISVLISLSADTHTHARTRADNTSLRRQICPLLSFLHLSHSLQPSNSNRDDKERVFASFGLCMKKQFFIEVSACVCVRETAAEPEGQFWFSWHLYDPGVTGPSLTSNHGNTHTDTHAHTSCSPLPLLSPLHPSAIPLPKVIFGFTNSPPLISFISVYPLSSAFSSFINSLYPFIVPRAHLLLSN